MAAALPTLDTLGWVNNPNEKATRLLAYFFVSDFSQSNLFLGHVQSLPFILASNAFNFDNMSTDIETALSLLFKDYFDGSSITVAIEPEEINGTVSESRFNISLDVKLIASGVQLSLGRMLTINRSTIEKIISIN